MKSHKHPFPLFLFLVSSFVMLVAVAALRAEPQAAVAAVSSAGSLPAGGNLVWLNPQPQGNDVIDASCQTAMQCYAITPLTILRTEDGGHSWTLVYSHVGFHFEEEQVYLNAIDCADEHYCIVLGDGGARLQITGGEIALVNGSPFIPPFVEVDCVTASLCYATTFEPMHSGGQLGFWKSEDGGIAWVPGKDQEFGGHGSALACPAIDTCFLVTWVKFGYYGSYIYTTGDGGDTWVERFSSHSAGCCSYLEDIECISALACIVVEADGYYLTTRNGGESWEEKLIDSAPGISRIGCQPSGVCYAVGHSESELQMLNSDWTTWQPLGISVPSFTNITCPEQCVAVGQAGFLMTGQGTDWHIVNESPYTERTFNSVDCPTLDNCVAVGDGTVARLQLQNLSLQSSEVMTSSLDFRSVSCAALEACYAIAEPDGDYYDIIVKSTDGGENWTTSFVPPDDRHLHAIDCPTTEFCVVAGGYSTITPTVALKDILYVTRNGGKEWDETSFDYDYHHTGIIEYHHTGVDCPTADTCYVLGSTQHILKTTNAAQDWQVVYWDPPNENSYSYFYEDIDCASDATCTALGSIKGDVVFLITRDGGDNWSIVDTDFKSYSVGDIDCTSSNQCMAFGFGNGAAFYDHTYVWSSHDGGATWSNLNAMVTHLMHDVKCLSSQACLLVGDNDTILGTGLTLPNRVLLPVVNLN